MKSSRLTAWSICGLSSGMASLGLFAGEASLPPAQLRVAASNGQQRVSWTPVPAAEQFKVLSATNLAQPCVENTSGSVSGYDWTASASGPMAFHRLQVTPLSSNDLFAATVLHRLTYGPTPDDIERIRLIGPQAFIDEQMAAETLTDSLDSDPPITNAVPPPPPLTNWIRLSATGTAGGTNFGIYLSGRGMIYIDDVRLVLGTNADEGTNILINGDFEDPVLSPPWFNGSSINQTATMITNSPTLDGLAASGTNCLLLVQNSAAGSLTAGVSQPFATNTPSGSERFTLSFSYLPVENTSNTTLTVRLSGSATIRTVTLPPAPPAPPAPPTPVSPLYTELSNTTATLSELRAWHVLHAVQSKRQLHEILVQFFENHFSTEYQKVKDWFDNNYSNAITNETERQYLAVDMEWREHRQWREALLNATCTFNDLLKISIESPAMIIYLDTVLNSRSAANENYARELLELHTMGADNGYSQQDIVAMAQVWTGWRVAKKAPENAGDPFAVPVANVTNDFGYWVLHFTTNSHNYTSNKWLFTNTLVDARFGPPWAGRDYSLKIDKNQYPLTNGMREGYVVIDHLANVPHTMEFLSVKLCRLFVHENFEFGVYDYTTNVLSPEAQLVRDCMTSWDAPGPDGRKGNIRQVLNVIFNSALFRGHAASRQKVKTPLEFAVSAVRALRMVGINADSHVFTTADTDGYGISGTGSNTGPLARMGGMGLFNRPEPDGFSELGRIWLNTANLCERMRFVQHLLMPANSSTKDDDYGAAGSKNLSDPAKLIQARLPGGSLKDAGAVADFFLALLFPGEGRANLDLDRNAAINFLNSTEAGGSSPFAGLTVGTATYDGRIRGMVALLLCLPRFQEQ